MSKQTNNLSLGEKVTRAVEDLVLELSDDLARQADEDDERELIEDLARGIEMLLGSYERSR